VPGLVVSPETVYQVRAISTLPASSIGSKKHCQKLAFPPVMITSPAQHGGKSGSRGTSGCESGAARTWSMRKPSTRITRPCDAAKEAQWLTRRNSSARAWAGGRKAARPASMPATRVKPAFASSPATASKASLRDKSRALCAAGTDYCFRRARFKSNASRTPALLSCSDTS
jgi:hypothetical protein